MERLPADLMQPSTAFERVVEEMEWSEVISTLHTVVKEMLGEAHSFSFSHDSTCAQLALPSAAEVQTENVQEVQNSQVTHLQPVISNRPDVSSPQTSPQTFTAHQAGVSKPSNITYILITPGKMAESLQRVSHLKNMQETQQYKEDYSRVFVQRPPNAFAFFAREHRPKVVAEYHVKNGPTVNQILGKKWKALSMEEQVKYYLMAHNETYTPSCKPANQPGTATLKRKGSKPRLRQELKRPQQQSR